ncbi:uncharacterized protein LOC131069670 [Cryptomeria japonica]|uniref:uncharacterized protein LOC131069670 n=1 Tax=Cryptomeria japonica TaxID=3369 RepID=UPI0027DA5F39|nr:uncharacterized protein LOC131069670 [Cryptomeria japonica]
MACVQKANWISQTKSYICALCSEGRMIDALPTLHLIIRQNVPLDSDVLGSLLQASKSLPHTQQLHTNLLTRGFIQDVFLATKLVHLYASCGLRENARMVFDSITKKNIFLWNAMIRGYAWNGPYEEAIKLYYQMQEQGTYPDGYTYPFVLKACAALSALQQGREIHYQIVRSGIELDVFIGTALVDMYAKCVCLDEARQVFDKMSQKNVVSWNAIVAGSAQNGRPVETLEIFRQMQKDGVKPDSVTVVSLLPACARLEILKQGNEIHGYVLRNGFDAYVNVGTSLIDMYAKCGRMEKARNVFDGMLKRDVASWNAMIVGYAQNGDANEALALFDHMQVVAEVEINLITLLGVLPACGHLAALQQGKWIHDYAVRNGFELDVSLVTALIDMYVKCGSIEIARQLFDRTSERDLVLWNAMIGGYGMHGHANDAVALFSQLQETGMKPDEITFIGILNACGHAGLVEEGWRYFHCMSQMYGITPTLEHYACMVNLLGRCGKLDEAKSFISNMPLEPDAGIWGTLLGACRVHCHIELAEWASEHLFYLEPKKAVNYILLSNIYAAAGMWDGVAKVRAMMKETGLTKSPGCSWIELGNKLHTFLVGDQSHPQSAEIYAMWESLLEQMKKAGYVADKSFVLHDVEDDDKESIVGSHSEKLAVAFGIINTDPGVRIQVTKNLRVCGDCHNAIKHVSKIVSREIIVRDPNRFHHFRDGYCSCGDYWYKMKMDVFSLIMAWGLELEETTATVRRVMQTIGHDDFLVGMDSLLQWAELGVGFDAREGLETDANGGNVGFHFLGGREDIMQSYIVTKEMKFESINSIKCFQTRVIACGENFNMVYLHIDLRFIRSFSTGTPLHRNLVCKETQFKEALQSLWRDNSNNKAEQGIAHDPRTFSFLLNGCQIFKALSQGKQLHTQLIRNGFYKDSFLGTRLIAMYAANGRMVDARQLFDKMPQRNKLSWNAMIRGYAWAGPYTEAIQLYYEMQQEGVTPDNYTFPIVLKACASLLALEEGKKIHQQIRRLRLESDIFVAAALIDMYAKCESLDDARQVFDKMPTRDVVSWNVLIFGYLKCGRVQVARDLFDKIPEKNVISWTTMIAGYVHNGLYHEVLTLFDQMQETDMKPNRVTVLRVITACAHLAALQKGKEIHDYATKSGLEADASVVTALINMYAKCGRINDSCSVFDKMPQRNNLTWNAMIRGYARDGPYNEAIQLYYQMQQEGVTPDNYTFPVVLKACASLLALEEGKEIHHQIRRIGLESDIYVAAALIDMYAKCGSLDDARQVFDKMPTRDVVSWNVLISGYLKSGRIQVARHLFDKIPERNVISWTTMIAGYVQNGLFHEALILFDQMQETDMKPNRVTLVSVLPACAHLAALQKGKEIHDYATRSGLQADASVVTALINMYAKCGRINVARGLFDKMPRKDAIAWNAMIAGYGMHGLGEEADVLFVQMQQARVKPDDVTFIGVLSACSHAGLVEKGSKYFNCMSQEYCLEPKLEHYACMVDLLSRAGHLNEARDLIESMPFEPSPSVLGAFLGGCRIHGNIRLGEHVAERLLEIEPNNIGNYVLLSNIYAEAGRWDDVTKMRIMLKERGLKKSPGCSWIELSKKVHAFIGGDRSHAQSEEIYKLLGNLSKEMKKAGYVPDTSIALHDVAEEEKEFALSTHSERLAIAFGILNTAPGTAIQITKNLRVCGDCHTATKFISKIVRREIIVRDINRFHHFKDGLCSCGDYW